MSEKKIVFHALERLDLVDVEALQSQVFDYTSRLLNEVIGKDPSDTAKVYGGMLKIPSTVTVTNGTGNAYTINFERPKCPAKDADPRVTGSCRSPSLART